MKPTSSVRALVALSLVAAFGAGCARMPLAATPEAALADGFEALSSPVSHDAVALAQTWQKDATQVGVMINRSPKGVQDTATYVFSSDRARTRMLIVIASRDGLTAKELAVSDRAAEGLVNATPLTRRQGAMLSSKKIFKKAEYAGLKGAEDLVVVNTRVKSDVVPVAIVTDLGGENYIVMDAITGEPLTEVGQLSGRHLQMHIVIIGGVVLAVAVGAAVWWAVKKWRHRHDKPSDTPTPIPSATPVPTPVPSSKPSGRVAEILAGPFGDMFARLDSDHDGQLTVTEYLRPAKDETTERVKSNEWREFIDVRHANKVDRASFLAGVERSINNLCDMSFSMLDGDQDGGLTGNEAGKAVPAGSFRSSDTNHDGKLSREEYVVPFAQKEASFAQYYK